MEEYSRQLPAVVGWSSGIASDTASDNTSQSRTLNILHLIDTILFHQLFQFHIPSSVGELFQ